MASLTEQKQVWDMLYFNEEQIEAVRGLLNNYLTEPLSLKDMRTLLSQKWGGRRAPAIKSRKKRYVIAIINAMARTIEEKDRAVEFRSATASALGIGADLLRTESAKIVRHSKKKDAVNEKIYELMEDVSDCLFR